MQTLVLSRNSQYYYLSLTNDCDSQCLPKSVYGIKHLILCSFWLAYVQHNSILSPAALRRCNKRILKNQSKSLKVLMFQKLDCFIWKERLLTLFLKGPKKNWQTCKGIFTSVSGDGGGGGGQVWGERKELGLGEGDGDYQRRTKMKGNSCWSPYPSSVYGSANKIKLK